MKLILILLLIITGLWILVRLFEARSRMALGLLLALLLVVFGRWSQQPAESPRGGPATYAATAEQNLDSGQAAGLPAGTSPSQEERPGAADSAGVRASDAAGEAASTEAGGEDDLQIELVAEEGRPIRPPIPAEKSWVESDPVLEGEVHRMAISSGPCNTPRECKDALAEELEEAVDTYVDWYLGKVYGDRFRASQFVDFDADYVWANLVNNGSRGDSEYEEVIQHSFGPMYQQHALLTFGPEFRQVLDSRRAVIDQRWKQMRQTGRVLAVALGFGLVLALLGVVFGYFRLDTATRGYYTGRLQFASVVAILAVVVAGFLLARHVPWM